MAINAVFVCTCISASCVTESSLTVWCVWISILDTHRTLAGASRQDGPASVYGPLTDGYSTGHMGL
jgi:hypothetical protein